jgi:hypothetical protein
MVSSCSLLSFTRGIADNSAALALRDEHKLHFGIYQLTHGLDQVSDLPLRPGAETLICHVDQFPEITGQIQRRSASIGEDIPRILVRDIALLETDIITFNL